MYISTFGSEIINSRKMGVLQSGLKQKSILKAGLHILVSILCLTRNVVVTTEKNGFPTGDVGVWVKWVGKVWTWVHTHTRTGLDAVTVGRSGWQWEGRRDSGKVGRHTLTHTYTHTHIHCQAWRLTCCDSGEVGGGKVGETVGSRQHRK